MVILIAKIVEIEGRLYNMLFTEEGDVIAQEAIQEQASTS